MARLDFFTGEGAVNSPAHIRPANNGSFPLIDAHDVQVGSDPTDADDRLDATLEDIDAAISNINDEIGSGSSDTNATIKKRLAAAETNIGNKVNRSDIQTTVRAAASASDSKIPSEKAVRSAIDNATVSTTNTPASGSAAAFSAGGAYTELNKKVNTSDIQGTVNTSSNPPSSNAVKTYVDAADALKVNTSDIQTTVRAAASASDSKVPSEKAVRSAIDNATVSTTDTPASGSAAAFSAGGAYTELAKKVNTSDVQSAVNTSANPVSSNAVKTYVDAADALKINTSDIQTTVRAAASASDSKIPSEKAVRSAIDNATVSTTDTPASGSAAAFSAGGAYTELAKKVNTSDIQSTVNTSSNPPTSNAVKTYVDAAIDALSIGAGGNYYTKEEANQAFYTAIVISSASLSKTTFEQGDSSNAATLTWHTNTLAVSAKVSVGGGTATETITSGERKNNGTYSTTIDTSAVNSNGSKSIAVKLDIEDAFEGTASKTVNATICNNIILGGAIKATASNGASVLADENMTQKLLQSSKNIGSSSSQKSVTVAANKYLTIAIPTAYGTPNKFYVNGSDIALPKIATGVSLTNQFNKTVTYDIYQNNQAPTSSTLYTVYTA